MSEDEGLLQMVRNGEFGYIDLLISDWTMQLTARRCAAQTAYMSDRVRSV